MEIFHEFGVSPILLIAQIINFLILFVVLKKFAYKPILEIIEKRQKEIEKSVKNNELAKDTLEKAQEKEKQILSRAQERSERILADAKNEAIELKTKIEESTKKETERMLEQARVQIQDEARQAEEKLSRNIGKIAVSLLEKSLQGLFGQREQQQILKKADEAIKKSQRI